MKTSLQLAVLTPALCHLSHVVDGFGKNDLTHHRRNFLEHALALCLRCACPPASPAVVIQAVTHVVTAVATARRRLPHTAPQNARTLPYPRPPSYRSEVVHNRMPVGVFASLLMVHALPL